MATAERKFIFFRSNVTSPSVIDTVWDNEEECLVSNDAKGVRALLKLKHLSEADQEVFQAFYSMLKLPVIKPDDFIGLTSFDSDYMHQWFTYPIVANDKDKPVLQIGAIYGKPGEAFYSVAKKFPLFYDETKEKYFVTDDKGKQICQLHFSFTTGDNEKRTPWLVMKNDEFVFHIGVKIDQETSCDTVERAFEVGALQDALIDLLKSGANFTKLFSLAFKNNLFPSEGVMLLLTNGTYSEQPWENKVSKSARYNVAAYSRNCEGLPLVDWRFKDSNEPVTISDIGMISFSDTTQAYKNLMAKPKEARTVYLFVQSPSPRSPEHSPLHTTTTIINRLHPKVTSFFAEDLKVFDQKRAAMIASNNAATAKAIAGSGTGSGEVKLTKAESEF